MVEKSKKVQFFTDKEIKEIKSTFADREDLLITMRKMFLQLPYTEQEEIALREALNLDVINALSKKLEQKFRGNEPIGQDVDFYMTIQIEGLDVDMIVLLIEAREFVIDYMEWCVKLLSDTAIKPPFELDSLLDRKLKGNEKYVKYTARNTIVGHIRGALTQIMLIAGTKDESEEEQKKRLDMDSSQ